MKQRKTVIKNILYWTFVIGVMAWTIYTILSTYVFISFRVPSGSMEPTIQINEHVLVNKLAYGRRIFSRLDTITHGDITRGWSYSTPQRNDIVVFNTPNPKGRREPMFMRLLKFFVKRCVALPGDTFEIRDAHYFVRGCADTLGYVNAQNIVEQLTHDSLTIAINHIDIGAFPRRKFIPWTIRNMGPFYIPKCGDTITLNRDNMLLYGRIIEWEMGGTIEEHDDMYYLGDSLITQHIMQQGCYFMAGDNAPDSQDSRYWGLVPEEFIVGRVCLIY